MSEFLLETSIFIKRPINGHVLLHFIIYVSGERSVPVLSRPGAV